ncbi:MAG TPA: adenylate/guanylate cyclase domain-containing protein [Ignavibacteria bacterium]|nr:adenylate/guanylate cyclase domain-containing protein [Ignavibacteria bacterium]
MSVHLRRNLNSVIIFTAFTSIGAVLYAIANHGFNLIPITVQFLIGFFFGLITSLAEVFIFENWLKRKHFSLALIIRSSFYIIVSAGIILFIVSTKLGQEANLFSFSSDEHENLIDYATSIDFIELLGFSVVLSFFVNFVRQINKLLGQNVLFNYVRGKYQLPLEEELIFMFLDLKSSTTIAEKLGHIKNHEFLNDFFHDMTDPILECKGKIYQYVGDEIVLTWHLKEGLRDLNCIDCFFDIQNKIYGMKDVYLKKYGVYPEFKAGLHYGMVITGEMGDIKKDIVYHGDTVNTSARIQAECNKYDKKVLISKDLKDKLHLDGKYTAESMGNIRLRGKEKELELFSIEEA